MMENIKAKIIETDAGRTVLFYLEPSGPQMIFHQITSIQGIGQADISFEGSAERIEKVWEEQMASDFAGAVAHVEKTVLELEEATS